MHILIVEDKENLRQMLTAAVERMGFAVDTAEDARQAQLKIKQRRYDLILTDLRLPKGSGLEILSYSRELDDAIPVIVMTAYGTIEEAVSAMKNGAFDFIQNRWTWIISVCSLNELWSSRELSVRTFCCGRLFNRLTGSLRSLVKTKAS